MTNPIEQVNETGEIEVTPAMVEAGREAYAEYFLDLDSADETIPGKMVTAVFVAMLKASK